MSTRNVVEIYNEGKQSESKLYLFAKGVFSIKNEDILTRED